VAMCPRRRLLEIKGFSELKVDKVKEAVAKCQPGGASGGFITAHELRETRRCVFRLSTGSRGFDAMLGGCVCSFSSSSLLSADDPISFPSMGDGHGSLYVGGSRAGR
jgi:hypothetical protein